MQSVHVNGFAGSLPLVIPVIPRGMFETDGATIPSAVVGVSIENILTKPVRIKAGHYILPEGSKINPLVLTAPIFHGKQVILFSTGRDMAIETLWWERDESGMFDTIEKMGFVAVTGMNFSVFDGECPCAHALNTKKSLCFCEALSQRGVPTIPHIYAENAFSRARWIQWLRERPHIRLVTINTQLQRSRSSDMAEVFKTIDAILNKTGANVIVQGRATGMPKNVKKAMEKRMHFAVSSPCKKALIRKDKPAADHILDFYRTLWAMAESD